MDLVLSGHFVDTNEEFEGTVEIKAGVITKVVRGECCSEGSRIG